MAPSFYRPVWFISLEKAGYYMRSFLQTPSCYRPFSLQTKRPTAPGQSAPTIQPRFQGDFTDLEYRALAQNTRVERSESGASALVQFQLESAERLDSGDTYEIQKKVGYHPCGYNHFYGESVYNKTLQKYVTTWWCNPLIG